MKHVPQIKKALEIGGVYTESSSFVFHGDGAHPGFQIDLLIGRNDQVINICELKFHKGPLTFSKADAENLRNKMATFIDVTGTRKQAFLTLVTSFGIIPNQHSIGLVDNAFTMDILFEKI